MSDTPRTDALTVVPLTEMLAGYRFRHYPQCDTEFARRLERELRSIEQALLAEKAKVFSAWVDMERIGDELGLPLEGVGLLLAIDPILDMGRTALNVTGQSLMNKENLGDKLLTAALGLLAILFLLIIGLVAGLFK